MKDNYLIIAVGYFDYKIEQQLLVLREHGCDVVRVTSLASTITEQFKEQKKKGLVLVNENNHPIHQYQPTYLALEVPVLFIVDDGETNFDCFMQSVRFECIPRSLAHVALLTRIRQLLWYFDQISALTDPLKSKNSLIASKTQSLIIQNPSVNHSLDELASKVGTNRTYLTRAFKSEVGMSVHEWRRGYCMKLARCWLLDTQKSVLDIALDLGYSQSTNFSVAFKQCTGCSPRAYRFRKPNNTLFK
ncbi:helix-turn-helix domain-containing protein [Enterovibrio nigricans]|uniref:AraC-type DNA-binding protein n=1 Tax=Enterovibrio nigricans DSM 22720 TaxID=1121868 RepID=A0A1T4VX97_9GAMM|nr:AraC family transcriptional regulator [Enterovibrio nigricans]SKA69111.1 AraC-type DNA-binding protein [Enterovibrio nigricans DSM 22720]